MDFKQKIGKTLEPYQRFVEKKIEESAPDFGPSSPLKSACLYALKNGGKRFRPALVLMIAKALSQKDVSDAALSVEYFHTASLIADDLPCMDDDDKRRGAPSLHKAFDEATALLASYALISAGYDKIRKSAGEDGKLLSLAIENASFNTGIFGATGGQYLDLYPPKELNETILLEVIQKKTGTLFELSFVFGWLFGGGDPQKLSFVKNAAAHFGMAFQIVDDFFDAHEDAEGDRKINAVLILGREKAIQKLEEALQELKKALERLDRHFPELLELAEMLSPQTAAASSS